MNLIYKKVSINYIIKGTSEHFLSSKSSRIGVGHDVDGNLLILTFDGDEKIETGINLRDFATIFIKYGAVNAINLIGGESTTVYKEGQIINYISGQLNIKIRTL
jgi:exopolysaccharide biosynthesis protein